MEIAGTAGVTGANGEFNITVASPSTFLLDGTAGVGSYTAGGTWKARELIVARSLDGGQNFTQATVVHDDPDLNKWILETGRDPVNPNQQNVYIAYGLDAPTAQGVNLEIHLAASYDAGLSFPVDTVVNDDAIFGIDRATFGTPSVGPNGEVYVVWDDFSHAPDFSDVMFDVSLDGGVTFGFDSLVNRTDVTRFNGHTTRYAIPAQPDRGILTVPSIAVDHSLGPNHGRIYVAHTVEGGGQPDTDVVVQFSDNNGQSWTTPLVVHEPDGNSQFLPWLDVDPWTGNVGVVFYDARLDPGNEDVHVSIATSVDAGSSFQETRVTTLSSNMVGGDADDFLEYIGVAAFNGRFDLVWTDNSDFAGSGTDKDYFYAAVQIIEPDQFEPNNTLETATILGSEPEITLRDLTIHKPIDDDWFKITANDTGKLIINAFFDHDFGNIDISVSDASGNIIVISQGIDDNEQMIIPVVSQEMYFLRVYGFNDAMNVYDLEIENFAAPVPSGVHLDPASDTGMMNNDNITRDNTPDIVVLADLSDFAAMGIPIDPASGPGANVRVFVTNITTGASQDGLATAVGTTNTLFRFTPTTLGDGVYLVSAAVEITDGQGSPVTGRSQLSEALLVTIDTTAPAASLPDMLTSSDTGMDNQDNVTSKMSPAFQGTAEANAKIRVLADGVVVGQGVVGSEGTDGNPNNGLGHWEVTVEPLADAMYQITTEVEDLAGNISTGPPLVLTQITNTTGGGIQCPSLDQRRRHADCLRVHFRSVGDQRRRQL